MLVTCISDLHGNLPTLPESDLLLIAGDICPWGSVVNQLAWFQGRFIPWVGNRPTVFIAGNHDELFTHPHLIPTLPPNLIYLEDSATVFGGLTIYGSPWSLWYGRYKFMASEEEIAAKLETARAARPHIILSHSPPFGIGDIGAMNERAGIVSLRHLITEEAPWLCVVGHIHEGYGVYELADTIIVNASHMNHEFLPKNSPVLIDLLTRSRQAI